VGCVHGSSLGVLHIVYKVRDQHQRLQWNVTGCNMLLVCHKVGKCAYNEL
jgi:hypothetical protein